MKYTFFSLFMGILVLSACKNDSVQSVETVQKPAGENAAIVHNTVSAATPSDTVNVAKLTFEMPDFDFGTAKEGDVITHAFKFKNTGNVPLLISDARSTCGCTVPEWPKEAIPVGGTGEISAKFNTEGKSGNQVKVITLTANTYPSETKVSLAGEVKAK